MEKLKYYKYKAFLLYSKINFYHIMKGNEGIVNTILIIFFIVPILGMEGYILSIFVSELLNFSVSLYQLKRRVNFSFPLLLILKCVIAVLMSYIITSLISFNGFTGVINLVINVSIFIIFYFIFTFISKCYIFKK